MHLENKNIKSWGNYPKVNQRTQPLTWISEARTEILNENLATFLLLPYGQGRSYGDSCLNADNTLLLTQSLDRFISFDTQKGLLRCEAGVTLENILNLVVPQGWFLPVVPGTQFVSVGGAVANDIHGKNHHRAGTFGCHVLQFELLRSDGTRLLCSRKENPEYFNSTIAGLGLTGLILWVEIQLKPIESPWIRKEDVRFRHLEAFFELTSQSDQDYEYTVGWLDCLSTGTSLGRGVFFRGNHMRAEEARGLKVPRRHRKTFPCNATESLLNPFTMKAFNTLYYVTHPTKKPSAVHYQPFFFPLDGIRDWNRLYGKRGFLQYQCVVPYSGIQSPIKKVIQEFAKAGLGSFLTVIKTFGDLPSPGLMSFPRPGVTLTLDLPFEGPKTLNGLERLDAIVAEHGGCVYPAKDARLSKENFQKYFPQVKEFSKWKDPKFSSSFWRRVT